MDDYEKMSDDQLDQALALKLIQATPQAAPQDNYESLSDDQLDEMLASKIVSQEPQDRSIEAFTQGFGNAATMGYLPQIQAIVEPGIQKVADMFLPSDPKGFEIQKPESSYLQRRDQYIQQGQQLAQENPNSSLAGNIAGAIGGGIATGGAIGNLLGTGARAATFGGRLGQAAKAGAVIGAIRNPGDTEGEISPLQLGDRARNTAMDAATGAVVQGGLEVAGKVGNAIKNAGKNIGTFSQRTAIRASGATSPQMEKLISEGTDRQLGQAILDNNLIKSGDGARDIANNAKAAIEESGDRIGKVYEAAGKRSVLNKEDVRGIVNEYSSEASSRISGRADTEELANKIDKVLNTIPENGNYGDLRKWRSSIDDQINFAKKNNDLPEFQKELKSIRSKVQEKMAEKLGTIDPELKKEFIQENARYSKLQKVKTFAEKKAARNESNTSFGIREGFGATLGAMMGSVAGPVGTAAGAGLGAITTNVARKYGTPFVAMSANKIARGLEQNPKLLGTFAEPLIEASASPEKFVSAVNLLLKKPEFKRQLEKVQEEINSTPVLGKESEPKGRSPSGR